MPWAAENGPASFPSDPALPLQQQAGSGESSEHYFGLPPDATVARAATEGGRSKITPSADGCQTITPPGTARHRPAELATRLLPVPPLSAALAMMDASASDTGLSGGNGPEDGHG